MFIFDFEFVISNLIKLETVDSTNRYCGRMDLPNVSEFTTVWALRQTDGVGQRGNHWFSEAGANLTFSVVLHPVFLTPARQFELTKAISLGVSDWLISLIGDYTRSADSEVSIKWPNDVFVGGRKICGILIENRIGVRYETAICGIGLNVNQTVFGAGAPNATSLKAITGREYGLARQLQGVIECLQRRYDVLLAAGGSGSQQLDGDYLNRLLNLGVERRYIYKGSVISATITGLSPWGHLLLTTDDGSRLQCAMKEIAFLHDE